MAGRRVNDISGIWFGRLKTIKLKSIGGGTGTTWLCECLCGKRVIVPAVYLKTGDTKSCGCLKRETSREMMREMTLTHGDTQRDDNGKQFIPPEWTAWHQMRYRCLNPKSRAWKNYGGRGIKVCKRWEKYEKFLADMGRRPSPDHSLDRINNDRDYKPSNCRWATMKQQSNNRRKRA